MKHLVRILSFVLLIVFCSFLHAGEMRRWTGANGKVIEAEFLGLEGDIVRIKVKTGREMNVLLSLFSEKDQEIIKRLGSTENPFGEDNATEPDDPDKFAKPEKIRFTLEMSEKGRAKLRVEKPDEQQKQTFDGKTVTLPGFPKLEVKTRPDGISQVIYDCRSPLPKALLYSPSNVELDEKTGKFMLRPNTEATGKNTDGWSVLSMKQIMQLPMKISFDATITHRGECCNIEMIFSDCILTCHAYCEGKKIEDDMKILCRVGDEPFGGGIKRVYQDVLSTNISLDEPFESSFTVTQLKSKADETFRGGIGRNLNRPEGVGIIRSPLEINRITFEGRLKLPMK